MWLKAPFGPEQVAGSLTRMFTNAPAFVVGDFPLLQPGTTSALTSKIAANVQNCAFLRMGESRQTTQSMTLQKPHKRVRSTYSILRTISEQRRPGCCGIIGFPLWK